MKVHDIEDPPAGPITFFSPATAAAAAGNGRGSGNSSSSGSGNRSNRAGSELLRGQAAQSHKLELEEEIELAVTGGTER